MKINEILNETMGHVDPSNRITYNREVLPSLKDEPYDTVGLDVPQPDAIQDFEFNDNKELVAKILKQLPPRWAQILYFTYFKDKTQADIARIFGVSNATIQILTAKAHRRFRDQLTKYENQPNKLSSK